MRHSIITKSLIITKSTEVLRATPIPRFAASLANQLHHAQGTSVTRHRELMIPNHNVSTNQIGTAISVRNGYIRCRYPAIGQRMYFFSSKTPGGSFGLPVVELLAFESLGISCTQPFGVVVNTPPPPALHPSETFNI